MMRTVFLDMAERDRSISILMEHIIHLTNQKKSVDIVTILKSSFYVSLYNNVEATVYGVLENVHNSVSKLAFSDLSLSLQNLMISYFLDGNISSTQRAKKISELRLSDERFPQFSDYIKKRKIFSGNLDARKIREIVNIYGMESINFSCKTDRILTVKNKRNKISHGELSLSEAGRGISNYEIQCTMSEISIIMKEFVSHVEGFLSMLPPQPN